MAIIELTSWEVRQVLKAGPFHAFQLLPCQSFSIRWESQLCGSFLASSVVGRRLFFFPVLTNSEAVTSYGCSLLWFFPLTCEKQTTLVMQLLFHFEHCKADGDQTSQEEKDPDKCQVSTDFSDSLQQKLLSFRVVKPGSLSVCAAFCFLDLHHWCLKNSRVIQSHSIGHESVGKCLWRAFACGGNWGKGSRWALLMLWFPSSVF